MSDALHPFVDVPPSHVAPSLSLTADGYVDFFQIVLQPPSTTLIALTADIDRTWNGIVWNGTAIRLSGFGVSSDGQNSRPKLETLNPGGLFSPYVSDGLLDYAHVTRFRVLLADAINDNPVYISQQWLVGRIALCTRTRLQLELRTLIDVPNFQIPANTFSPPLFPSVTTP